MSDHERDPQQEYVDHIARREANRTSPAENENEEFDKPAQPGRGAASARGEKASPTGAVQQSDYPVDDEKRRG